MESIFVNNEKINVIVKNSKRSKNVTIHFEEKSMIVKKPTRITLKKVDKIIKQNMEKIAKLYLKYKENGAIKIKYKDNEKIMFFGNIYNIKIILTEFKNENIKIKDNLFLIYTSNASFEYIDKLVKNYFTKVLTEYINENISKYEKIINVHVDKIKIRYMKTRFGSAIKAKRSVNFSTLITMFKKEVIDSVIVHELCHLVYDNHSKDFWDLVYKVMPEYDEYKKWIKQNNKYFNI